MNEIILPPVFYLILICLYLTFGYVLEEAVIKKSSNNIIKTIFILFYPIFFILAFFKIKPNNKKLNEEEKWF